MENNWKTGHEDYDPKEDGIDFIYQSNKIKEYLDLKALNKYFLVGRKGVGKSLLMAYKSHLFREEIYGEDYKYVPKKQMVESLSIQYETFSKDQLLQFREIHQWKSIWKFTLLFVVCKAGNMEINKKLLKMVDRNRITTILSLILKNRGSIKKFTDKIDYLDDLASEIQSGVAVFIDNLDQTFEEILKNPHYTDIKYNPTENPSIQFWINVQNGLMGAIYDINRLNPHIKIFTTIRQEAFNNYDGALIANFRGQSTQLSYSKEQIEEIFLNRIRGMKGFKKFSRGRLIEKFLGFSEMEHPFAKDVNGEKRIESVFDFLYRHTYGRPREIITFGSEIFDTINQPGYHDLPIEEKKRKIRLRINEVSYKTLFKEYKKEIIPNFSEADFTKFVKGIPRNILTRKQIKTLDAKLLKFYFNLGLIGYVKEKSGQGISLVQEFLPSSMYNYNDLTDLPESDYYLFHPSIDQALIDKNGVGFNHFYDKFNIVGNGYPFYDPNSMNYEISNYYPKVSGNRWDAPSPSAMHELPLSEYYEEFFTSQKEEIKKIKKDCYDELEDVLNLIGHIRCCNILKEEDVKYEKLEKEFITKLLTDSTIQNGHKGLGKNTLLPTQIQFGRRLLGRLIVIGCYSYLDLSCGSIHSFFVGNNIDLEVEYTPVQLQTSYKYLVNRFFIDGLIKDGSITRDSENSKKIVLSSASNIEKMRLSEWHYSFLTSLNNMDWINPNHLDDLTEKLISLKM